MSRHVNIVDSSAGVLGSRVAVDGTQGTTVISVNVTSIGRNSYGDELLFPHQKTKIKIFCSIVKI